LSASVARCSRRSRCSGLAEGSRAASRSASAWARRADHPAIEAGDDAGVAAQASQREGSGVASSPSISARGMGAKVRNSITADRVRPRQRKSNNSDPRRAAESQGQGGVEAMRDPEPREEIGEERSVGFGPRDDHSHVLEGHSAAGCAQEASHDGAGLRRLAGSGDHLHRAVVHRRALRRLEERVPQPLEAGRDDGGRKGSEHRLLPLGFPDPHRGGPCSKGGRHECRGQGSLEDPHACDTCDRGQEPRSSGPASTSSTTTTSASRSHAASATVSVAARRMVLGSATFPSRAPWNAR
jgi:hypothetical protein